MAAASSRGDGPIILVVDDDKLTRWAMSTQLRRWGYQVREADTGNECLNAVADRSPDLVLLDVILPDKDGVTILAEIRAKNAHLPVILMTANPTAETRRAAAELGASGYVQKPWDPIALRATVTVALQYARS